MILKIVIVLAIIFIITLLLKEIKIKKNIWQKISFLYNQLYIVLIKLFYNNVNKKNLFKEELLDYYNTVVKEDNLVKKYSLWQDIKQFIIQYASLNKDYVKNIYDMIDIYYKKYYYNVSKVILLLSILLVWLLVTLLYLFLK